MSTRELVEVEGRALAFSSLEKVLYPATGFRKADLLAYYRAIAPVLLPHLADRALHLGRWPSGVEQRGWLQANCPADLPWLRTHVVVGKRGQTLAFTVIDDLPSLLWAANLGTIELHPFHWVTREPTVPRAVVFDLDPGPDATREDCARAAREVQAAITPLQCFVKTSGGKGLHVLVPTNGGASFAATKAFARGIARELAARHPTWLTDTMARTERTGRIFIDTSQNDPGKQTIAPYSLRATPIPLVSAPLARTELDHPPLIQPPAALARMATHGDLFADVLTLRQTL